MTLRERVVEVLERWCGDTVLDTGEKLKDLWDRTKPTGTPSHSGIPYFSQGASDLVDRLRSEYQRPRPEMRDVDIAVDRFDPDTGTILTIEDLFVAVSQCKEIKPAPVEAVLSAEDRSAIAQEVAAMVIAETRKGTVRKPAKKKAAAKRKPAPKKRGE